VHLVRKEGFRESLFQRLTLSTRRIEADTCLVLRCFLPNSASKTNLDETDYYKFRADKKAGWSAKALWNEWCCLLGNTLVVGNNIKIDSLDALVRKVCA
jgi:hypothetical protein